METSDADTRSAIVASVRAEVARELKKSTFSIASIVAFLSVSIALGSYYVSRNQLITQQQPWVGLDDNGSIPLQLKNETDPKGMIRPALTGVYEIVNYGGSPALELGVGVYSRLGSPAQTQQIACYWSELISHNMTETFKRSAEAGVTQPSFGGSLFPGQKAQETIDDVEIAKGASPRSGKLLGCIRYRDQFGLAHETDFCFEVHELQTTGTFSATRCALLQNAFGAGRAPYINPQADRPNRGLMNKVKDWLDSKGLHH